MTDRSGISSSSRLVIRYSPRPVHFNCQVPRHPQTKNGIISLPFFSSNRPWSVSDSWSFRRWRSTRESCYPWPSSSFAWVPLSADLSWSTRVSPFLTAAVQVTQSPTYPQLVLDVLGKIHYRLISVVLVVYVTFSTAVYIFFSKFNQRMICSKSFHAKSPYISNVRYCVTPDQPECPRCLVLCSIAFASFVLSNYDLRRINWMSYLGNFFFLYIGVVIVIQAFSLADSSPVAGGFTPDIRSASLRIQSTLIVQFGSLLLCLCQPIRIDHGSQDFGTQSTCWRPISHHPFSVPAACPLLPRAGRRILHIRRWYASHACTARLPIPWLWLGHDHRPGRFVCRNFGCHCHSYQIKCRFYRRLFGSEAIGTIRQELNQIYLRVVSVADRFDGRKTSFGFDQHICIAALSVFHYYCAR